MSEVFHHRFPTYDVLDKWDTPGCGRNANSEKS
jgi:hypothetical protein